MRRIVLLSLVLVAVMVIGYASFHNVDVQLCACYDRPSHPRDAAVFLI